MTPEQIRQVAREQNERDFEAGIMPTRHVEDLDALMKVARLLLAADEPAPKEAS
jgi:hypothetical protein